MKFALLLTATFCYFSSLGQTTDIQLGYQEFPTIILGHASDAQGNMYYTGTFKGELTVSGKVLATGSGVDDIFWIKMNAAGNVIRSHTYGSPNAESSVIDNLVLGGNQLFFIAKSVDTVHFGNLAAVPYQTGVGAAYTSYIVSTDTTGSVKWITSTNANLVKIYAANNLVHAVALNTSSSGAIKVDGTIIFDSIGKAGLIYMVFDTTGHLLGKKTILLNNATDHISIQNVNGYSKGGLFFLLRMETINSFSFNGQFVGLPSRYYNYHVAIKTDTSFANFTVKILNPGGHAINDGVNTPLAAQLAPSDSLYMVLDPLTGTGSYIIDGFTIPFNMNVLAVMDSNLIVKRIATIGSSFVSSSSSTFKRRIFYRNLLPVANTLYFTGQYVGTNEAPMNVVPVRDTIVPIIGTSTATVDLNGPSKSFVAKADLGIKESKLNWYGDHRPYENSGVSAVFLHRIVNEKIAFVQGYWDNTWNPFVIDSSLALLSGGMIKNADRAELPRMISFFPDGNRFVLVSAAGRTALDSGAAIPSNAQRMDLCLLSIKPNGTVRWFKRIQTTFIFHEVRRMIIKNNKSYFLVDFRGTQNDSNYVKVDNQLYAVSGRASLLASVDSTGNVVPINLSNIYKDSVIMDFSFFPNGDMGILATANPGGLSPVVQSNQYSVFRVDASTGSLLGTRQLAGTSLGIYWMEIDTNNNLYFSMTTTLDPSIPVRNLYLNNGISTIDSIELKLDTTSPIHQGLLKMNWDKLLWSKRFYGGAGGTAIFQNDLFLINNRPVLGIVTTNNNQPLYWENQLIQNGAYAGRLTLVGLDTAGNLVKSRYVPGYSGTFLRKGSGEKLYLSGSIAAPSTIDTIQIGNSGLNDALGLVLDSNFVAKRSFRLGSYYSEAMYDMDIYKDSLAAFTYLAQVVPQFFTNRVDHVTTLTSDLDPDAFVTAYLLLPGVVTGISNPPPANNWIRIKLNPVRDHKLTMLTQVTQALPSACIIFSSIGQLISTTAITIAQGKNSYDVSLPKSVQPGVYYLVVLNQKWQTNLSFVIQ